MVLFRSHACATFSEAAKSHKFETVGGMINSFPFLCWSKSHEGSAQPVFTASVVRPSATWPCGMRALKKNVL